MPAAQVGKEGSRMMTRVMGFGAALLCLAAGTGFAAEVDFGDLTDTLSVTLSADLKSLGFTTTFSSPESIVVTGNLPFTAGTVPPVTGARQVVMTEPSSDPFNQPVSDIVVLDTEIAANGGFESVRLEFDSDFNSPPVPSPNISAITVTETGASQDLSTALHSLPLQITAVSDLAGGEPTPLPASAWAGMALLGGLAAWRIVRGRSISIA